MCILSLPYTAHNWPGWGVHWKSRKEIWENFYEALIEVIFFLYLKTRSITKNIAKPFWLHIILIISRQNLSSAKLNLKFYIKN